MDFSLGLNQSQQLQQRMQLTAQMIHGLDLLQLPLLELSAQIDKELVENPVLEIDLKTRNVEKGELFESEKLEKIEFKENSFTKLDQLDGQFDDEQQYSFGTRPDDEYSKMDAMDNNAAESGSLVEYLSEQMAFMDLTDREKLLIEHLIFRLNDNGFFDDSLDQLLQNKEIEATDEEWKSAIELLQSMDPDGIGAFSMEESLLIQLKRKGMQFPLLEKIIKDHFQDVLHNKLPKVAKELEISLDELKNVIHALRGLNPKPGAAFTSKAADIIKPDIIVENVEGEVVITVSNAGIPKLGISSYYSEMMNDKLDSNSKKYLKEKLFNARKIIESLDKRKETLYKISKEIVRTQKDFFKEGVSGLKPLMMQEVAELVGMHVSTVCRTVANKYLQCSLGTFPLKYFFVNSSGSDDGSTTTQEVLQKIKDIIDKENKKKPLSDQAIVELLKKKDLKLARRTVTKYREQMGIPSSVKRKDH